MSAQCRKSLNHIAYPNAKENTMFLSSYFSQSSLDSHWVYNEIDAHKVIDQDLNFLMHRLLIMFTLIIY